MQTQVQPNGKALIHEMDIISHHGYGDVLLNLLHDLGAPVECTSLTGNTYRLLDGYAWVFDTQISHGCMMYMFVWSEGIRITDQAITMKPKQIEYKGNQEV